MKKKLLKIRKQLMVFLTHQIGLPMLKLVRRPNIFTYTEPQLQSLPAGTLGNDLFIFLKERDLPLLKHYTRHDLKHVLLGYDTTEEGEACLQSFMLGNGRISFPVLATVTYGFITMPEYRAKMRKAFQEGQQSESIHGWNWNEILELPTERLREKIFMKNKTNDH